LSDNSNDKNLNNIPDEEIQQEEILEDNAFINSDKDIMENDDTVLNISDDAENDGSYEYFEETEALEEATQYEENTIDESIDNTFYNSIIHRLIRSINEKVFKLKNTEPKKRAKIILSMSFCILLVILVITDFIPILPNAYNRFYVGNSYVIGETRGGVYDKMGKDIVYAGSGSIISFAPSMKCNFKIDTVTGLPRLETDGNNAIVHYKNSNEVYVITNGQNISNIKSSYNVTGATINDKGYYGFVSDESGYESCVEIYNPKGSSLYKWHTNNPVIDVSVSDNGQSMIASSYTADNSLMSGKLIFFDLGLSEPIKEVVTNSNIISEVKFIDNDVAIAFGDLYTAAYTSKGVMKWRIDYAGRNLKSYDISENGEIAFIFDRYNSELSESTLEIYNNSGRLKGRYESRDNIKYVSANNNCFLLSLDKKTVLLDSDGDVMKKRNSAIDFRHAVLFYNYNFAFSVSDSIAEIMSVNH